MEEGMSLSAPDWLKVRDCSLKPGIDGRSSFVFLSSAPQYELTPVPVKGKFGCEIRQVVNGKRLDGAGVYPSEEEALRGGLEELRKKLGW
jgi:hypothetical protein